MTNLHYSAADESEDTLNSFTSHTDIDQANQNRKTNEKEPQREQDDPLFTDSGHARSEILEWLQEFRENLVDDEIPEHGDSHASSSHEASSESTFKRREDLGEHSVYTHFPKDRNCEICKRTEYSLLTAKDQSRIHQFGKKVSPGLFLGCALYAG